MSFKHTNIFNSPSVKEEVAAVTHRKRFSTKSEPKLAKKEGKKKMHMHMQSFE